MHSGPQSQAESALAADGPAAAATPSPARAVAPAPASAPASSPAATSATSPAGTSAPSSAAATISPSSAALPALVALLGKIPAPALVLAADGRVEAANARAADVLFGGARAADAGGAGLAGRSIAELVTLAHDPRAAPDAPLALAPGTRDATTRGPEVRRLVLELAPLEPTAAGFLALLREPPLDERALQIRIAREKHDAIAQLAAGTAHEFNNIMATLFGFAQLAGEDDRYLKDLVDAVVEYAERSREITARLRAFSREHDEPLVLVELPAIADLAIARVMPALERSRIRLERRFAGGLPATLAAPGGLRDVIEVVLENARRSIVQSGEIVVEITQDGGALLVRVSDTGTGIPRENLSRVFEPFFAMKAIDGGPVRGGLGLAVALSIVRRHRGDMWAESQLGRGTSIFVRLPIRAERRRRQPADVAAVAVDRRRIVAPRMVLLVDAEESTLRLLESVLAGHQIVRARGGEDALRAIAAEPFDYAIVDPLLSATAATSGPGAGGKSGRAGGAGAGAGSKAGAGAGSGSGAGSGGSGGAGADAERLDGWGTIAEIARRDPRVKLILLTDAPEDDRLRGAVARAYGYLRKPFGVKDVPSLVV